MKNYTITIQKVIIKSDKAVIQTSNSTTLYIPLEIYSSQGLFENRELTGDEYQVLESISIRQEIYEYAFKYLSVHFATEKTLLDKFRNKFKNVENSDIEEVISRLKNNSLLNDELAFNSLVEKYKVKKYSARQIEQKLQNYFDRGYIKSMNLDIQDDEDLIIQLATKKLSSLRKLSSKDNDKKIIEKLNRFLLSRGYQYRDIKKAVESIDIKNTLQ